MLKNISVLRLSEYGTMLLVILPDSTRAMRLDPKMNGSPSSSTSEGGPGASFGRSPVHPDGLGGHFMLFLNIFGFQG